MAVENLLTKFRNIRRQSEEICQPLYTEDYVVQTIFEVSPPKWHLAHITWFFENFLLLPYYPKYKIFNENFHYLFNSYYNSAGKLFDKNLRGILSRPPVEEIYQYRKHVDNAMLELISGLGETGESNGADIPAITQLGLNHEQQHQELLLMDIKNIFFHNPLKPLYRNSPTPEIVNSYSKLNWIETSGGITQIGHNSTGFCFDNELPVHKTYLENFKIGSRPVLNGEYLEFISSGGYQEYKYWLSDGWEIKKKENWQAPLYWHKEDGNWYIFTLNGLLPLDENEPVSHVSYYEADAFALWAGKRLPTEFEWERVSKDRQISGNFLEKGILQPASLSSDNLVNQLFGDVWEWTKSAYLPYPGFQSLFEGFGEYNGKFMINQMVLRGGCCVTPADHLRKTYRNFYFPQNRWQFSGIRLASDDKN
jgi:ergothioneine biosynthesis protein EgtB